MMMKVCVVGPGAVGSQIAVALVQGGAAASVLARGAHLDAIRDGGIVIATADREERVSIAASDDAWQLGVQDVVIFTVKAPALAAAAMQARPLLGENTEVVAVINGVPWWFMSERVKPLLDPDGTIATTSAAPVIVAWSTLPPMSRRPADRADGAAALLTLGRAGAGRLTSKR